MSRQTRLRLGASAATTPLAQADRAPRAGAEEHFGERALSPPPPEGKAEGRRQLAGVRRPPPMGFLKRMATILGFLHGNGDEGDGAEEEDRAAGRDEPRRRASFSASASASAAGPGVRRGFSVQVPVAVERPHVGPILVPCDHEEGGVQGFTWYGKKLKFDEDGDVADEFLNEVFPDEVPMAELDNQRGLPTFKINYSTRPAAVKKQIVASDGNVRQGIEHRGRLQWV